jgi:hypothetical protein
MKNVQFLFAIVMLVSCNAKRTAVTTSKEFLPGKKLAELTVEKLDEVSGLAASINNPGLLWAHNDSGNGAQVFLLDQNINIVETYTLQGVENRDWEDIAVGPGPDSTKNYVYVGEIGDNSAAFQLKHVYRFEEPIVGGREKNITVTDFDTITFQLPDLRKDTEALLIDPKTKDLYIISKSEEPVFVYQLKYPYSKKDTLTALQVGSLPLTQIVAGDFSPDGSEILMKNYDHIYYWKNSSNKTVPELLREIPLHVPYEVEPQGESITGLVITLGFIQSVRKTRRRRHSSISIRGNKGKLVERHIVLCFHLPDRI